MKYGSGLGIGSCISTPKVPRWVNGVWQPPPSIHVSKQTLSESLSSPWSWIKSLYDSKRGTTLICRLGIKGHSTPIHQNHHRRFPQRQDLCRQVMLHLREVNGQAIMCFQLQILIGKDVTRRQLFLIATAWTLWVDIMCRVEAASLNSEGKHHIIGVLGKCQSVRKPRL